MSAGSETCWWFLGGSLRKCGRPAMFELDYGYNGLHACRQHLGAVVEWAAQETEISSAQVVVRMYFRTSESSSG